MFRTVNFPFQRSFAGIQLVLCILIGCLSMHFLLEDTQLLTASASSNTAQVSDFSYDEMTHQDDLVILVSLPVNAAKNNIPSVTGWTMPFKKQFSSPILTPPKIV
jgi:hypothetical protein